MKRLLFLLLILLLAAQAVVGEAWAQEEGKVVAVYFHSPTCASCVSTWAFLEELNENHENLDLRKYDISDLRNKSLLDEYSEAYGVSEEDRGIVPVVFIRDKYFTDIEDIRADFEKEISSPGAETLELRSSSGSHERDLLKFKGFKAAGVLLAGLANGINPCSISMLLFFLSLLTLKSTTVLKAGISFVLGKFVAYFLLGTILFKFLSLLNFSALNTAMKALLALVLLILVAMSLQDFFAARGERYDKIWLQLPEGMRRLNHNIIKRASHFLSPRILLPVSFFLGMILSLGEFLCTGQIYLATIITVFQADTGLSARALLYLAIYNSGLILPLILLTLAVYKGKGIFEVSDAIRERLHIIKMINAFIFFIFGIIILLFL